VDGRDDARDARSVGRAVEPSPFGRVVRGRFAVGVVEGATECLDVAFVVLVGGDGPAAPGVLGVLRAAGRFFSSPDVTEAISGSASGVVLDANVVRLTAVPGAGRAGGLLEIEATVLVRVVFKLDATVRVGGRDALAEFRASAVDDAVGRRAPAAPPAVVVGRRGGTPSLEAGGGAFWAILRRTDDVGVEGAGNFFGCCGLAGKLSEGARSREPWLAGVGVSMWGSDSGVFADQIT
jgi:hypothetical protein